MNLQVDVAGQRPSALERLRDATLRRLKVDKKFYWHFPGKILFIGEIKAWRTLRNIWLLTAFLTGVRKPPLCESQIPRALGA